jgi:subtilisin family serine protease
MKKLYCLVQRAGIYYYFAFAIILFTNSLAFAQQKKGGITPGVLHIKVTEQLAANLERTPRKKTADNVLLTGIESVDAVHKRFKVRGMKRVFRPAGKYEIKHQKYGLHLWYRIQIDSTESVDAVVSAFRQVSSVTISEPVYKKAAIIGQGNPVTNLNNDSLQGILPQANDPYLQWQWHYDNSRIVDGNTAPGFDIRLFRAWELETGNNDIIVAVVDGGIQTNHEDLVANMWNNPGEIPFNKKDDDGNGYVDDVHGYNFLYDRPTVDIHYHGTHVAGTVAATTNNGIGVAGVAGGSGIGDGARLMTCEIFNDILYGGAAEAYVYSADEGAIISQNSWGYGQPDVFEQVVLDGIDYFIAEAGRNEFGQQIGPMNGGIVMFAAGNANSQDAWYPAYYERNIAVAASNFNDQKSEYSNYGDWIDITAPGDEIWSTFENGYGRLSGTSMACPQVSGVAALIISKYGGPGFTPAMLREKLFQSADNIDADNPSFIGLLGSGRLNAYAALHVNDQIPPEQIEDLSAINVKRDTIILQWTAPLDAEGSSAYRYDIRYSTDPITENNFASAATAWGIPAPGFKGTQESFVIPYLEPSTTYYFAIRAFDFYGNASSISNVLQQSTLGTATIRVVPNNMYMRMLTAQTRIRSASIINSGDLPLTFTIQKGQNETFAELSLMEGTVQPKDTLNFQVTFRSHDRVAGIYEQSYTIYHNGFPAWNSGMYVRMDVIDNGVPLIVVNDTLNFKTCFPGIPKTEALTIHNGGSEPLLITNITSENPVFVPTFTDTLIVAPLSDVIVNVTFLASRLRDYSARLFIYSNDTKRPLVYVRMLSSLKEPPDISVTPASMHTFVHTDQKITLPLTVKNTGFSDLVYSTTFTMTGASDDRRVLILTSDPVTSVLTDLFNGADDIQTEVFPRDSIAKIKLAHLTDYDVVFVNNLNDWKSQGLNGSPEVIGNVLADYIDQGGKVIVNLFSYYLGQPPYNFTGLQGRFMDEMYGPFLPTGAVDFSERTLGEVLVPDHPLMEGVEVLEIAARALATNLVPDAIEIARWDNGYPLVAVNNHVVGVNALQYDGVLLMGDFPRLYENAVNWLMNSSFSINPQKGLIPAGQEQMLDISFDASGLKTNATYERTLLIQHNVPGKDTLEVPISIEVLGPRFTVSPDSVYLTLDSPRTATRTFTLYNNGDAIHTFTAAPDVLGYVTVTPESGTVEAHDSTVFTMTFDAGRLAFGLYESQIALTMDGYGKIMVPVILSIESAPQIGVDPLQLEAIVPYRESLVKQFVITNTGGRPLEYTIDVSGAETDNGQSIVRKTLFKEDFEGSTFPPAGWTVIDNEGFGLLWNLTSAYGQPNWAGTGEAAMASGSSGYGYEIDTELQSPIIYAKGFKNLNLQFTANHYRGYFDNLDRGILDVDIRSDSSTLWKNVLHWTFSHGGNYDFPGELVNISLDSVLENASSFQIRWRHYVPPAYDTDEYTQIDDILLSGNPTEWLSATPVAGEIPVGASAVIDAEFVAEDLDAQSYNATIIVQSNALDNPLVSIDATIHVMKPAIAILQPDSVYQTLQKGDSTTQIVMLTNNGESDLTFSFDEILAPQAMQEKKARRISTAPKRTQSSGTTIPLDDARAIPRPASTLAVAAVPPYSAELYSTGFEEFYPGELDGQEGWIVDPGIWSIEAQNPLSGLQHFRGVSDGLGWAVAISPNRGGDYPPRTSCTMMINLDSAAGVRWQIVPQAPQSGLVATRVEFTTEGIMRALVQDSLDFYSGYFVEIPVTLPKGYFELRIDMHADDETFLIFINNKKVFTGDAFVPHIDEVAFVSTMEIAGPMLDIDNFAHYLGIPPLTWVKAEPVSGIVPSGASIPIRVYLNAANLPDGTYNHVLTMATNDPEQANLPLPVTLRVSDQLANQLPVLGFLQDTTVAQTDSLIVTFTATDPDDSLVSVTLVNPPSFSNKINESNGSVTYAFSPSLSDLPGLYEMVVIAEDEKNGSTSGVFRLTVLPVPPFGVQNFSVIDMRTGETLIDFADSVSLDVSVADFKYMNIRANPTPDIIGSVIFRMDGKKVNLDNNSPYLLQTSILSSLSSGQHVLVAESYTQHSGKGDKHGKEALVFITNATAITGFEVVDHLGNFIKELHNGDELNASDPQLRNMNIRARVTETHETGSVIFYLNESLFRIDNKSPFTLAAGSSRWWSKSGLYTLSARPNSNGNGKGVAGDSLAVSFNILDGSDHNGNAAARSMDSSTQDEKETETFMNLFPIPAQGVLHVQFSGDMSTKRAQLIIRNIHSQVLYNEFIVITSEPHILDLEKMFLSNGIYYLQLRTQGMIRNLKFIKE